MINYISISPSYSVQELLQPIKAASEKIYPVFHGISIISSATSVCFASLHLSLRLSAVAHPTIVSTCARALNASRIVMMISGIALVCFAGLAALCSKVIDMSTYNSLRIGLEDWVKQEGVDAVNFAEQIQNNFLNKTCILCLKNSSISSLPDVLGDLTYLEWLILNHNQLTSLPNTIGNLTNLRRLRLHNNQLTSLPDISNLTQLNFLDISDNPNLTDLPSSLGECTSLLSIDFSGTQIPQHQVDHILNMCKKKRDGDALKVLDQKLMTWQKLSGKIFELTFIDQLSDHDRQILVEWLLRLEQTKDFSTESKQALAENVCGILETLNQNAIFKAFFFDQVSSNLTACGDRAAMSFNELYLAWKLAVLDPNTPEKEKFNLIISASKTTALRNALLNKIEQQEIEQQHEVSEGVEIYLYYEQKLKSTLNLLTCMNGMLYTTIGKRDWIDEDSLVEEVNSNYLECMIDFPSLITLRDTNKDYLDKWKLESQSFDTELEECESDLSDEKLTENEYLERIEEISQSRNKKEAECTLKWLKTKLTTLKIEI